MNNPFIHQNAIVEEGAKIGKNTRIWAFSHILPGAVLGDDCNICDGVFVENDVVIGNRVTIKCGVQVWDGITLEDDVFIGPNATFTNDLFPRSKHHLSKYSRTIVHKGASIGANATILPGLEIGCNAMVGAGAVVTHNVPQNAIVFGNPARINGYVGPSSAKIISRNTSSHEISIAQTKVSGAAIYKIPRISDIRGDLRFGEFDAHLPFLPKRFFVISNVPGKEVRGEHAHKSLHEFLICLQGSVNVVMDDGQSQDEIILNDPSTGLYLPPRIWTVQHQYSVDAILLVLASEVYEANDYIREYSEYLAYIGSLEN